MAFFESRTFKIIAGLFTVFVFYHSWIINHDKDFDIFIEATKLMFKGESPYERWLGTAGLKYYYSPFFAMILFPLKDTPQLFYGFIWTALNFYFLYRIVQLLFFFLVFKGMEKKQIHLLLFFCFVCSVRFILDNLGLGQMTIMLVWASLEIFRLEFLGKSMLAGALLALVINIKLLPIALLCYFVYKGSWKTVISTVAVSVLLIFLPALAWGFDFNSALHGDWLASLRGTSVNSIVEDDNRPGLSSLIPSLTMETPLRFGLHRNVTTLSSGTVQLITNIARLVFAVIGVLLISRPFVKQENKLIAFYDLSVICLLTPLVYPHQGKYALFYTLPAYAVVIFYLLMRSETGDKKNYRVVLTLIAISFLLVTLTTDGVITRTGSDFAEYYHLLTYGTFALLGGVWLIKSRLLAPYDQTSAGFAS